MKLSDYQKTVRHIHAPYGTQARILEACTRKKTKKSRAPRLITASDLALALTAAVIFPGKPNQTVNLPVNPASESVELPVEPSIEPSADLSDELSSGYSFFLKVSAAEIQETDLIGAGGFDYGGGNFFMVTDGKLERCGTLFFQLGRTDETGELGNDSIERIDIESETGVMFCYHQLENSDKDWEGGWDTGSVILPRTPFDEAVADPENPTKEEIRSILTALNTGDMDAMEYHDPTYLSINAGANGTMKLELLPILDTLEIQRVAFQTKNDISTVIIDFKNPQNVMREKDVKVKSVSVQSGEEIEWMPDMEAVRGKEASAVDFTAFSDLLSLKVYYENGSTITGEIHIDISEGGKLQAYFEMT